MSPQLSTQSNIPSRRNTDTSVESDIKTKKKQNKFIKVFGVIAGAIITILVIAAVTLIVLMLKGQKSAVGGNKDAASAIEVPSEAEVIVEDDSDTNTYVYYNGKKYKYNDKVTTVLFAGIDKQAYEQTGEFGTAGQADCIIVGALNTETGKYKLMAVSRDTMVDINILAPDGSFKGTEKKQVCLAYGYGDGDKLSCENLKKAVSRIMLGVPINAYAAIDLDAVPILNDSVGGVEVNVIEDLSFKDPALTLGSKVTLYGGQALTFVQYRDTKGDENQNNLRMERQKEYLTNFIKKTLYLTKEDFKVPLNMYNSVKDYTVTDIDAAMITYYTSVFLKTGFSADENFIKIPGTTTHSEKYAEYYVDNKALFDIILDTYYIEAE